MKKLLFFIFTFSVIQILKADVIFDGYYKVSQFKKHIGFFIQTNEVDAKNKKFITTTYLRLSKNGFDMTESLKAVSSLDFKPLSYSYTSLDKTGSITIDVEVNKNEIVGFKTINGVKSKIKKPISKDTFWASSLYYFMMNSKEGLKTGAKYKFSAVAEERAEVFDGKSQVESKMVSKNTFQLLKVNNSFASFEYENLISNTGQNYSSFTPATGIETELVTTPEEATNDIKINNATLEKIFGRLPTGKINLLNGK